MSTTAAKKTAAKKTTAKKSKSGNPATRAAQDAAAQAASDISAFKKRTKGVPLPLPSGLIVHAKRVELQTLVVQGNVPNPLMEVVSEAIAKGENADIGKMVGVDEGEIDLDMVRDMFDMVEKVCMESITQPKIHNTPALGEERMDDLLYIDEVDSEDKMFIYQWACGGTSDVATFREEARADMATLAEKQGAKAATK